MKTKLEVYQERVQHLSGMIARLGTSSSCGAVKIFEVPGGEAHVWVLHERDTVSIAKAYLSPGAHFPVHSHMTRETIVLFEGSATYQSGDVTRTLNPGDCVSVLPEKPHRMVAHDEGAWFSVTTVPREEGLGDVG